MRMQKKSCDNNCKSKTTPIVFASIRPEQASHFNSVDALKNGTEGNGFNSLTMSKKLPTNIRDLALMIDRNPFLLVKSKVDEIVKFQ